MAMKKALREMQTLRTGCSKSEPKISPHRRLPSQFGEDQCMQFRVIIVVTDPRTHKQTHRQNRLQCTVPLSLTCSVINDATGTKWLTLEQNLDHSFDPDLENHGLSSWFCAIVGILLKVVNRFNEIFRMEGFATRQSQARFMERSGSRFNLCHRITGLT